MVLLSEFCLNPFPACMFESFEAVSLTCISDFMDRGSGLCGGGWRRGGGSRCGGGGGYRSCGCGWFGRCGCRQLGGDREAFGILFTCKETMAEIHRKDSERQFAPLGGLLKLG